MRRLDHWLRVLLGLGVGAAVGVAVYEASQLTGLSLFLLAGATAGAVAAVLVQAYTRGSARLTDVTVTIPQISELRFALTADTRQVADDLFIEASTRVASRTLEPGAGFLREAFDSLHALFIYTRQAIKQVRSPGHIQEPNIKHLGLSMLNHELAPFLSRWHPELYRWEQANQGRPEDDWPRNAECRAELAELQARLRPYLLSFGRLAGMTDEIIEAMLTDRPL